ncbi:MAG: EVE domain-containing protein [Proteobacteria bacterium]|nr:EVE domain-containing protein [Pseudomonadota bacterium]
MKYWLMKTEPDVFSWDDLEKSSDQTGTWEGVRNYQARNFMRDDFKQGDQVFFYHSSCETPGIVGLAEVVREGYPDPSALDPKSSYYDAKSVSAGASRWIMVNVRAKQRLSPAVTLSEIKAIPELKDMLLIRPGQRLSIQPVTDADAKFILKRWGS